MLRRSRSSWLRLTPSHLPERRTHSIFPAYPREYQTMSAVRFPEAADTKTHPGRISPAEAAAAPSRVETGPSAATSAKRMR